jgi:NADH:ubiquinone reductase (non-electrogenic)
MYRIGVDEWLRVPSVQDVFALGDCAGYLEHTDRQILPALAQVYLLILLTKYISSFFVHLLDKQVIAFITMQVAERQGKYLATVFETIRKQKGGKANQLKDVDLGKPFEYHHLGSMASVGRYKALVDLKQNKVYIILFFNFLNISTMLWMGLISNSLNLYIVLY